jgi:cytochrome c oxidase assembly protein subunit 11
MEKTNVKDQMEKGKQKTLLLVVSVVFFMGALSYASVPLYKLFCQVTGYGGTTQVVQNVSDKVVDRSITVRFDANVNPALDWRFEPTQKSIKLSLGENALAFYRAENTGSGPLVGTATFNVTPDKAGIYFNKVECFCFQEQLLAPNEVIDMPVSFFIDPNMMNDPNLDDVTTITLSYTFFRSRTQSGAITTNEKKAG